MATSLKVKIFYSFFLQFTVLFSISLAERDAFQDLKDNRILKEDKNSFLRSFLKNNDEKIRLLAARILNFTNDNLNSDRKSTDVPFSEIKNLPSHIISPEKILNDKQRHTLDEGESSVERISEYKNKSAGINGKFKAVRKLTAVLSQSDSEEVDARYNRVNVNAISEIRNTGGDTALKIPHSRSLFMKGNKTSGELQEHHNPVRQNNTGNLITGTTTKAATGKEEPEGKHETIREDNQKTNIILKDTKLPSENTIKNAIENHGISKVTDKMRNLDLMEHNKGNEEHIKENLALKPSGKVTEKNFETAHSLNSLLDEKVNATKERAPKPKSAHQNQGFEEKEKESKTLNDNLGEQHANKDLDKQQGGHEARENIKLMKHNIQKPLFEEKKGVMVKEKETQELSENSTILSHEENANIVKCIANKINREESQVIESMADPKSKNIIKEHSTGPPTFQRDYNKQQHMTKVVTSTLKSEVFLGIKRNKQNKENKTSEISEGTKDSPETAHKSDKTEINDAHFDPMKRKNATTLNEIGMTSIKPTLSIRTFHSVTNRITTQSDLNKHNSTLSKPTQGPSLAFVTHSIQQQTHTISISRSPQDKKTEIKHAQWKDQCIPDGSGLYGKPALMSAAVGGGFIGGFLVAAIFYCKKKFSGYYRGNYQRVPVEYDFELNPRLKTHST